MVEAVTPVTHLEDVTECAICHDTFTDPRILPCIHTFCLKCITEWYKDKHPQDCVNCPSCRKELKIPDNGVNDFPKNTFIGKLLNIEELPVVSVEPMSCDWCKSTKKNPCETAKAYCPDCQVYLCKTCEGLHSSIPATRQHGTIKSGDSPNGSHAKCMPKKCDKHPDKDLEIYCFDCADTVCLMCFVTQHIGHKPIDVKEDVDVVDEFKINVNNNISKLVDGLGKLDKSLAALEVRRSQIVGQANKVGNELRKKAKQLKQMIDRHTDKLLTEVNVLQFEKTKVVDNDISEVKQNKAMTESLIMYSQELLQKGSESDIARESKSINKRADELVKFCEIEFEFNTSEQLISFTAADVITDAINCVGKVEDIQTRDCQRRDFSPALAHSDSRDERVSAIAAFDNMLFVARESDGVEVYDASTLEQRRLISLPDDSRAYGLATCSTNNCLYVSDYHEREILKVSLSTYSIATRWKVTSWPQGLSVNRSHNLLVVCYGFKAKIFEYSATGSLVRKIAHSNSMWQAIELSDGALAVSRSGPMHGVCVMSVDDNFDKVLRSYGSSSHGSGPGQMNHPLGLAVDKQGFIVVADSGNNRIVVLNPTLTDSRVLLLPVSPDINQPCGLWYDESRGRLYVGERSGKRLLMFDNVFNLSALFS